MLERTNRFLASKSSTDNGDGRAEPSVDFCLMAAVDRLERLVQTSVLCARHPDDSGILVEVTIKSKRASDTESSHDGEARAVDEELNR